METVRQTQLFINGEYVDATRKGVFQSINPANGKLIANVADGTAEDIEQAVLAAEACLNSNDWGFKSSGADRAVILRRLRDELAAARGELAKIDALDMGKPLREAESDLDDALSLCEYFANLADEIDRKQYETVENGTAGDFSTRILFEPIGVVAAITPWNYPLLMGLWKVIPAFAAGCCVILKPSELAPLSCLLLGEICNRAGLPKGALNIVTGLGSGAGAALSEHQRIDKVSFTGSVSTARKIMTACAMGPRGLSLELGGKSALILFDDADIPAAVDWIMVGILWGSGQVCSATSRLIVQDTIREQVLSLLLERMSKIKLGDSLADHILNYNEGTTMGPVVNEVQYKKILGYLDEAEKGALNFACGSPAEQTMRRKQLLPAEQSGFYIFPTILTDVPVESAVWKEEIFGPVLCVRGFSKEEDAVQMANDTPYGLAGAVFTKDKDRCERIARRLRVGVVWQNCSQPAFIQAPWGGYKQSGFGRELGRWGLEEFTGVKQITSCDAGFSFHVWDGTNP